MANPLKMLKLKQTGFQFIQEIPINAPPARVWKTVLNVRSWFHFAEMREEWGKMTIEPHIGGRFYSASRDGKIASLHGTVTHIEREKILRLLGAMGMSHVPVLNAMIFELQPRKEGRATLLRFCHRASGYMPAGTGKSYQGGWGKLLPQLKAVAEKSKR